MELPRFDFHTQESDAFELLEQNSFIHPNNEQLLMTIMHFYDLHCDSI
jgi:hypothetical protein